MKNRIAVFIAIALLSVKSILNMSDIIIIPNILDLCLNILILLLLFPKIISTNYSTKELIKIIIIGTILGLVVLKTKEFIIVSSYLCILAIRDMDIVKIIKVMNRSKIFVVLIHVVAFLYCFMNNSTNLITRYTLDNQKRYSFFFQNQNGFAATIFWIICEIVFISLLTKKRKHHLILYLILFFISFFVYYMTISRTFLINCLLLLILVFLNVFSKIKKNLYKITLVIIPLIFIISLILCYKYTSTSSLLLNLDTIFSRRISLGNFALNKYGITLIPQAVDYSSLVFVKNRYIMKMIIDNVYIRYVISYGLVSFFIVCKEFYISAKKIKNKKDCSIFYIFVILYAIYGFTEVFTVNACLCFPLLFLSSFKMKEEDSNVSIYNNASL